MPICTCPASTAIPTIPTASCAQDFGQIQKIIFQRIYSSGSTKNSFTTTNVLVKASWTALTSAEDGTKIAVSPYVEAPTSDGGDAITFGGGNDTLGGVVKTIGRNPITMSFTLRQYPQGVIASLKQLQCENELGVYLVNAEGQILGAKDNTTVYPIAIKNLFVGDLKLNGLETPDDNSLSFSFLPNWSDKAEVFTPTDFNPLTDL